MIRILIVCFLFIGTYIQAQPIHSLDSLIREESKKLNFSGTVIIAEKDKIILSKSVGFADKDSAILNDTAIKYNIASVGKLFTQVIILQLIEENKIKLTDSIGKFFAGFNRTGADKITVFHLLMHSAGLRDVYVSGKYMKLTDHTSQKEVVKLIANEKLKFTPGSKVAYSNSGYYMLGAIASHVENKPFSEVVSDRIFTPLKMHSSGFSKTGEYVPNHALPYKRKGSKIRQLKPKLIGDFPSGAGSEYCSAADLYKFYISVLTDNRLLTDYSKGLLFNHYLPNPWSEVISSGKIFGFVGGDTRGWSAKLCFMFLRDKNYGVVILSNFDNMANELDQKMRPFIKKLK